MQQPEMYYYGQGRVFIALRNEKGQALAQRWVGDVSNLSLALYSGVISSYSASPKPWSYRVRRGLKGWDGNVWYPEKAFIMLSNPEGQLDDEATLTPEQIDMEMTWL